MDLLRSRVALEAEVLVLRQQINVLRRTRPKRPPFISIDRLILGGVCRLFPKMYDALAIVRPDTVIRWHRAGFRSYWRWKSRHRCGRPAVPLEIRRLIREMSIANPLWGAPRIHGELLKLGIEIGQTSVAKYMARRRAPPSQGWKTFLRNHADGIAAMDLFVVPTISFRPALWIADHGPWPAADPVVWGHRASDGRMDRQPTDGGVWLGANPSLPDPGPRWRIRRNIHASGSVHRYSRSPDVSSLTLAKRIRRTADRIDPQGMR